MNVLVTGCAGHLGEALVRTLRNQYDNVLGTDLTESPFTQHVGDIADPRHCKRCMAGVKVVFHTATLHKPHVATHSRQSFVDTNITGTLNLLEQALANDVDSFIFTSTTSTFGDALNRGEAGAAAWITEDVTPVPKNIYGMTKLAAENLCQLFFRNHQLPCLVLRTSRFFPEEDDKISVREAYTDGNIKTNEFLYRRVDIEDAVSAHLQAMIKAPSIGFNRYIVSATTPFSQRDSAALGSNAAAVVKTYFPEYEREYDRRGWRMFPRLDRVYVNERARRELNWQPVHDFASVLRRLRQDQSVLSELAATIGAKGYHSIAFEEGPYPVD